MMKSIDEEVKIVQYGFVVSDEFNTESTFDLVVPCLPRGALLELVPHGQFDRAQGSGFSILRFFCLAKLITLLKK